MPPGDADSVGGLVDALGPARVYDLEQPRYFGAPVYPAHEPGFHLSLHRRHEPGLGEARTSASALVVMAEHSGTHIDALCHQAEDMRLFGGRQIDPTVQTSSGFNELGAETIPPLIRRAVLLDAAAHAGVACLPPGHLVGARELEEITDRLDLSIGPGDVALVRTGTGALWGERALYEQGAGIGADASRWLASLGVAAVGSDNLTWDPPGADDPELGTMPGHVVLIVRSGIYIVENLFLEELARDGVAEFALVCLPLKMRGATGSPVRPVALVPDD